MSIVTDFFTWLKGKLTTGSDVKVTADQISAFLDTQKMHELATYEFAIHVGIDLIANALSKCEIRTFRNGQEVRGSEYYLWNYEPNLNMNASQFWQKIVWSLIYKNECLVIQNMTGNLLIADFYVHNQYANYPDTFEQVTINPDDGCTGSPFTFQKKFQMSEVFFFRLSNRNIAELLSQICHEYDLLMQSAVQKFYKSGGERGTLTIDGQAPVKNYGTNADGTPRTFTQVYTEMMNKQFDKYFNTPNGVLTMWSGFDYKATGNEASKKSTSEVKDVTDIEDRIYKRVANALQIPPALLSGEVSDVKAITDNFVTFCVDPYAAMIQREITRKEFGVKTIKNGVVSNYYMVDTSTIYHIDVFDIAASADKLIADSIYNVDEVRVKIGDAPLNTEWSRKYSRTKNLEDAGINTGSDPPEVAPAQITDKKTGGESDAETGES